MKRKLVLAGLIALSGCSMNPDTLRDVTAAQLGCAPVDVSVSNYVSDFPGPHRWNASCNGKNYTCMSRRDANKSTSERYVVAASCQRVK